MFVDKIDFRWSPFKEDIGIFGKKGEGKTTRAKMILDQVPNLARWIWSPQRPKENYRGYGEFVDNIEDLKHGAYVYTGLYSKENFIKFCKKAFTMRNILIVVDDVHEYQNKQKIPYEFELIILSGRNRGISGIYMSPLPARVSNTILGNCTHIFAYKFVLLAQIEWMRDNFFGDEAWLLIPKDKRHKHYISKSDPDVIPPYSVIYRKDSDDHTQVLITGGWKSSEQEPINESDTDPNLDGQSIQSNTAPPKTDNSLSRGEMQKEISKHTSSEYSPQNEA